MITDIVRQIVSRSDQPWTAKWFFEWAHRYGYQVDKYGRMMAPPYYVNPRKLDEGILEMDFTNLEAFLDKSCRAESGIRGSTRWTVHPKVVKALIESMLWTENRPIQSEVFGKLASIDNQHERSLAALCIKNLAERTASVDHDMLQGLFRITDQPLPVEWKEGAAMEYIDSHVKVEWVRKRQ